MKISGYKFRNVNLDDIIYNLSVNYDKVKLTEKEAVQYKAFKVVLSKDKKIMHFLVYGDYFKQNVLRSFEVCVEEIAEKDYDSSFISKVFFNNRNTINEIVRVFMNGYKVPEEKIIEQPKVEETLEFDDTFIESEVLPVVKQNEIEVVTSEPVIILPSVKNRSSSIKKAKPSKKASAKRKPTK